MSGITYEARRCIERRLKEHAFKKTEDEFAAEEAELANKAYNRVYSKKVRDAMAALPDGFLNEENEIECVISGENIELSFGFDADGDARSRPMRSDIHTVDAKFCVLSDDPLGKEIQEFARRKAVFAQKKETTTSEIRAALSSVRSFNQLRKLWPEARAFFDDLEKKQGVTALAVPIKNLNSSLGLPPATK